MWVGVGEVHVPRGPSTSLNILVHLPSSDLISPLEYIEESWSTEVLPLRGKVHPFREKLSVAEVTKVETLRNKIGEISLRFSALEKRSTPERYDFDFLKGETRGCFRIYKI